MAAPKIVSLARRQAPLAKAVAQVRLLERSEQPSFADTLARHHLGPLRAAGVQVLQLNLGKLCNQTCGHCHVDAGPDRRESMTEETARQCMKILASTDIPTVDITGGAPELNPRFRWLVQESRHLGRQVVDRCNLTVLLLPGQGDLGRFLATHEVEIVASLPYYLAAETDRQRGPGVFEKSVRALRQLNELGYGRSGSGLRLNLVYNPVGAYLPPDQDAMEADYKRQLAERYGVVFNRLYTITNMPISRFLDYLLRSGNYEAYMERLVRAFNPATVDQVMCRTMLSVAWDGRLYDCDFNQMLELSTQPQAPAHVRDFTLESLQRRTITTGRHCYGCTAGAGSSCGGATT